MSRQESVPGSGNGVQRPGGEQRQCEEGVRQSRTKIQGCIRQVNNFVPLQTNLLTYLKNIYLGRAQWLKPVIPALWEVDAGNHEVRNSKPAWST